MRDRLQNPRKIEEEEGEDRRASYKSKGFIRELLNLLPVFFLNMKLIQNKKENVEYSFNFGYLITKNHGIYVKNKAIMEKLTLYTLYTRNF